MADISDASWTEADASNISASPNGWPEGMAPSGVNNSARADKGAIKRWYDRANPVYPTAGSADAYVVTPTVAISAYTDKEIWRVLPNFSNTTTTPTVNISAVGAKTFKKITSGAAAALAAGDILSGVMAAFYYDTANACAILTNPQTPVAGSALLASANTFTANQTIQFTDAGATVGPKLVLDRNSASPATSDFIGEIDFAGRNSTPATVTYAAIAAQITDPTAGTEDAALGFNTMVAGTLATRGFAGAGLVWGTPTGGDKGAGTINATTLYQNGTAINLTQSYVKVSHTVSSGTAGGTATSGGWNTAPLNTKDTDSGSIASLSSNQVTLPAGTYLVDGFSYFSGSISLGKIRLYDVTNSAELIPGSNVRSSSSGTNTLSHIKGQIVLAGSTVVRMEYQTSGTASTTGLGEAASFTSESEVYRMLQFIKTA